MSHPLASEDTTAPVRVIEPDGRTVRHQPCHYRRKGLAVIDNTPFMSDDPLWTARRENGWLSDEMWSVTHEHSGASVCAWESKQEAVAAAQVLLLLAGIDWTKDMETVRAAVVRSRGARMVIATLKQGQLVVAQAGRLQSEGTA